jgi:hypothetical protein
MWACGLRIPFAFVTDDSLDSMVDRRNEEWLSRRQVKDKEGNWVHVKVADSIRALIIINLQVCTLTVRIINPPPPL